MPYPCPCVSFTGSIPCLFRILVYTHLFFFFVSYTVCISRPLRAPFRYRCPFSSYAILYSFLNRILPYLRRPVFFSASAYLILYSSIPAIPVFLLKYIRRYFSLSYILSCVLTDELMYWNWDGRAVSLFSFLIYFYTSFFIYCVFSTVCFLIRTYMATGPGIFPSFFVYCSGFFISFFVSYTVSYCLFFRILYRMFSFCVSPSFLSLLRAGYVFLPYGRSTVLRA